MPGVHSRPVSPDGPGNWTFDRIRQLGIDKLGKRPCWFQIEAAKAIYSGLDVIGVAPTGAGKTLSFWLALLMAIEDEKDRMLFIVSPLNVLAKQQVQDLLEKGISAVAITAENASSELFRDVAKGEYRVIITNPEILMENDDLAKLWKKGTFTEQIIAIVFDEGHCISQWGKFRKNYLAVGMLRYIITDPVPFYVATATLPPPMVSETKRLLHLQPDHTEEILCSNDRPDISLMVRPMTYPASSYQDLDFLIPRNWNETMDAPPKFLVFFDDIQEAQAAVTYLQTRLREVYHNKVDWFHSTVSQDGREVLVEQLKRGEIFGLCCTDAFGMGLDLSDVDIVVQYKATCTFCSLWQRFGRAARGPGKCGVAILLVEKKDLAEARKVTEPPDKVPPDKKATQQPRGWARAFKIEDDDIEILPDPGPSSNHDDSTIVKSELEAWMSNRREHYRKPEIAPNDVTNTKKGKNPGLIPGSALDDFINVPSFVRCRRLIPQLYFANDKRRNDTHLLCDNHNPEGCERCGPPLEKAPCCDLCDAAKFTRYFVPLVKEKIVRRSRIAEYTRGREHQEFEDALYQWRDDMALKQLGEHLVATQGAKLFLDDETLSRIVDCWAASKITNTSDLRKETGWALNWVRKAGDSLVEFVLSSTPPSKKKVTEPPPVTLPDLAPEPAPSLQGPSRKRAPYRCRGCGLPGHNIATCPDRENKPLAETGPSSEPPTKKVKTSASASKASATQKHKSKKGKENQPPTPMFTQGSSSGAIVFAPVISSATTELSSGLPSVMVSSGLPSFYHWLPPVTEISANSSHSTS
ncbi:hypothetical protein NP233_g7904 [Leucocoprinus birnbaumii]|uniref:DNA 3'-5' helicase n=1 Tax=Leucocoprinus birnbaumii TaxID=56174 RepID=A0AAD5YNK4_9AGAR|nr:hypothetical protein NP233_g7904 [Leucocoprinus birnbaumii]